MLKSFLMMTPPIKKISNKPTFYQINLPEKTEKIYLDINLKTGYADEDEKMFGVGHLIEHYLMCLLFEKKDGKNLSTNAQVGLGSTNYSLISTNKKILKEIKTFLDSVLKPNFNEAGLFNREKKVIENELRTKLNFNHRKVFDLILKKRFENKCYYSRDFSEQIKNIRNKKITHIQEYYNQFFNNQNIVFTLSGYKLDKKMVEKIFDIVKDYKISSENRTKTKQQICNYSKFCVVKSSKIQLNNDVLLVVSFPLFKNTEIDQKEKIIINMIEKFLSYSDLSFAKKIRNIGIYSSDFDWFSWKEAGLVIFSITVPEQKLYNFIEIFNNSICELKNGLIDQKELNYAKKKAIQNTKNAFKNNINRLNWITHDLLTLGKVVLPKEDVRDIKNIDRKSIANIIKKLFVLEKANIIFVGKKLENIKTEEIKKAFKF